MKCWNLAKRDRYNSSQLIVLDAYLCQPSVRCVRVGPENTHANDGNLRVFYLFATTEKRRKRRCNRRRKRDTGYRKKKEKTFGRTNDKRGWQRKTDGGLRKWAWRGRQKPIKWAAVELINNRSIKCRVNFISRVGGLIKTWVKRGVEETRWHGRACGSPLAPRLVRDAIWHSGLRGSTFSKQWHASLTNAACFCVSILRPFFYLFPTLSFHSLETWPHSSCFTNWDQPPDKRFGRRCAGLLLIDKTISNPSGRPNLLCHRHAHLQDGQYAQEPSFLFFFFFFLNRVTEFICRLPERRRGESRWVVGKWCEGASAQVSVKSAAVGRKSKEKFCAFTPWQSR